MRFESLATAAALGTARRPLDRSALPEPVAAALPAHADPAAVLLDAAAAYALARRAVVAPGPAAPPLDLPAATRPEAPAGFVALLRRARALGPHRDELTREALRLAGERGVTLPAGLLLELVAEIDRPNAPRRLLAGVLDERGWALLRLDSRWARRLEGADTTGAARRPELWTEGTLAQRVAHLTAVRAAEPAAGRALLDGLDWRRETADARAQLLRALARGLSADDEPRLEAALDDRARGVREVAADLLADLPGSAFVRRAEALAAAHLTRERRPLRGPVTRARGVPRTEATLRDGYPDDGPDCPALARRRLAHVVALVPPGRWPALLGASAAELAGAPIEGDGGTLDLSAAWAAAALRRRDPALARAVAAASPEAAFRLLPLLPPAERAALLVRLVRGAPERYPDLDDTLTHPFDEALTAAALDVAEAWLTGRGPGRWVLPRLLARLATQGALPGARGAAARLQALAERLPGDERSLRRTLADAAATLQLRAALAEALAGDPTLHDVPDDLPDEEG